MSNKILCAYKMPRGSLCTQQKNKKGRTLQGLAYRDSVALPEKPDN